MALCPPWPPSGYATDLADIDWVEREVKPYAIEPANSLLDICNENFLDHVDQMVTVTEPTRISGATKNIRVRLLPDWATMKLFALPSTLNLKSARKCVGKFSYLGKLICQAWSQIWKIFNMLSLIAILFPDLFKRIGQCLLIMWKELWITTSHLNSPAPAIRALGSLVNE